MKGLIILDDVQMDMSAIRKTAKKVVVFDFPSEIVELGCYAYFIRGILFIDRNHQQDTNLYCVPLNDLKEKSAPDVGAPERICDKKYLLALNYKA